MKRFGLSIALCFVAATLGCSQMVEVKQDFDHYADFESFTTYDWLPQPAEESSMEGGEGSAERRNVHSFLEKAIAKELAGKGFVETVDNPDIFVVYYLGMKDKMGQADFNLDYSQEFKNSDVWHMGGAVVVVELVKRDTDHLVWRGQAHGAVNVDPTPEMVEKNVNRAIAKLFEQYPPETLGDR